MKALIILMAVLFLALSGCGESQHPVHVSTREARESEGNLNRVQKYAECLNSAIPLEANRHAFVSVEMVSMRLNAGRLTEERMEVIYRNLGCGELE